MSKLLYISVWLAVTALSVGCSRRIVRALETPLANPVLPINRPLATPDALADYQEALTELQRDRIDLAEKALNRAIAKNPDLAEAHVILSRIYVQRGLTDQAEQSANTAIQILERTRLTMVAETTADQVMATAFVYLAAVELRRAVNAAGQPGAAGAPESCRKAVRYLERAMQLDMANPDAQTTKQRLATICASGP